MSSNFKITFEDWLADKTFEEYHFNREIQDHRYQISVQRLILEKRYRDIIKKREFIDDDTFDKIRNAQKASFKKVRDSLAEYHLENIELQKANSDFLEIKSKNLKDWLKKIENEHPMIIENVYRGEDYSAFIWGGAHEFINSTTIDQHFRFMKLAEDEIQSFGEPNPNILEEETFFKELEYRRKCAEILDLNIKIRINRQQTNLLSSLLNGTNNTSPQVSDRRGDNMKEKILMPEDKFWEVANDLWMKNPEECLSPKGNPSSYIIENLLRLNYKGYKVADKQNEEPVKLTKSTIRRRLKEFPYKWQKIVRH